MSTKRRWLTAVAIGLLLGCNRTPRAQTDTESKVSQPLVKANPPAPTRLLSLPFSAYSASLGMDAEAAYLMTRSAAYRLVAGRPPQKTELDLGTGPVLADSGIVFWSKGAIWNASKQGGSVWRVAAVPAQPEYFVASNASFAWLDRVPGGPYRIQSLDGNKPRVLVSSQGEISAVHMIHDSVFFVQKSADSTWRVGRVHRAGGEPEYAESRSGPTPAMLAGAESPIYYDMGRSAILQLTADLKSEHVWLKDFVCSPIHETRNVYCARVEGLFEIVADTRSPRPLLYARGDAITAIRANAGHVVWVVDAGPDQLAVETLPLDRP